MLQHLHQLYQLLDTKQKRQLLHLQLLVMVMVLFEALGVAAIAPFMALVADPSLLARQSQLAELYQLLSQHTWVQTPRDFLLLLGGGLLLLLVTGACFSMLAIWRLSYFAANLGADLAHRLYSYYLHQPWLYHTRHSSSGLTKQIATEATRVTQDILHPLIQINARLALVTCLALVLLIYSPVITLVGITLFTLSYLFIFRLVHRQLHINGKQLSDCSKQRFKLLQEGFGAIKTLLLLHRQQHLQQAFEQVGKKQAQAEGQSLAMIHLPRYLIELITFGGMILLILLLLLYYQAEFSELLPLLSVYALAGFKMLPALQFIYNQGAHLRANQPALEAILPDLQAAKHVQQKTAAVAGSLPVTLEQSIELEQVTFTYPDKNQPALTDLSLTLPTRQLLGIAGVSGSGKSTLVDLLLGLIQPDTGKIKLDGKPLAPTDLAAWQASLGYVPQHLFLSDASLAENIAFALPPDQIDHQQLNRVIQLAQLEAWISTLPQGLNTPVGEGGVQISGGQRQRIGIARALYSNAATLIFDEATSALDTITEQHIMQAIQNLAGEKTILLIAHRLNTLAQCDCIYLLESGRLIAQGSYQELLKNSHQFKQMAHHA